MESGDKMKAQKIILASSVTSSAAARRRQARPSAGRSTFFRSGSTTGRATWSPRPSRCCSGCFEWFNDKVAPVHQERGRRNHADPQEGYKEHRGCDRGNRPQLEEIWTNVSEAIRKMWKVAPSPSSSSSRRWEVVPRAIDFAVTYILTYIKVDLWKIVTTA